MRPLLVAPKGAQPKGAPDVNNQLPSRPSHLLFNLYAYYYFLGIIPHPGYSLCRLYLYCHSPPALQAPRRSPCPVVRCVSPPALCRPGPRRVACGEGCGRGGGGGGGGAGRGGVWGCGTDCLPRLPVEWRARCEAHLLSRTGSDLKLYSMHDGEAAPRLPRCNMQQGAVCSCTQRFGVYEAAVHGPGHWRPYRTWQGAHATWHSGRPLVPPPTPPVPSPHLIMSCCVSWWLLTKRSLEAAARASAGGSGAAAPVRSASRIPSTARLVELPGSGLRSLPLPLIQLIRRWPQVTIPSVRCGSQHSERCVCWEQRGVWERRTERVEEGMASVLR